MARARFLLLLAPLAACTPDYGVKGGDTGAVGDGDDTGVDEDEVDPADYDGSTLQILEPEAGAFIPLGEDTEFTAVVLDAEGNALEDVEIVWTSDIDTDWGEIATSFEDDSLEVGTHTLTAQAWLPNGAVVTDRAGAIRVQHEDAGTYVGNMVLDVTGEYEGTPLTASCIGAAVVVVDGWGEVAAGNSDCIISLLGFAQEATIVFDLGLDDGELAGESALDLSFIQYGFETAGEVEDGVLVADWADNVFGFADIEGSMELERVTRDVE